ncbi:HEAT repeat domain-containing protein [Paenibacillus sp. DLE-14]|uniref:HEAT repeat domain-containing protein n=2 Tax=Paenibacillus lignilyticus TaxID=1172615 RepID=A0ABS5CLS6_9BACL|nr:HEAT repeat domain-containing protein [Paenibacillus lignilyticus]MBP3966825.1 HEAT repeat domain-containing protein [Paenibacillus lignilyticus]
MEHTEEEVMEQPVSYEELKKAAGRTSNWRERLRAVEELGQLGEEQATLLLKRIAQSDMVHQVQAAAQRVLKELGEEVEVPTRKTGELVKGLNKILVRIKKSLPDGHTYEEFKEKLKKMRSDVYDIYEGDKEADFDQWLESTWASLSRR